MRTPVVVFVAGLGDSGETAWRPIWSQMARSTRARIYDRAGLGPSDPGAKAATYQGAADGLHALLQRRHVAGPYVLVGHSLGGLLARLYTHDHPSEVAGVVLADATPVGWLPDEARLLSELALRSKGHWGYDQAFLDACRAELTLAPEDLERQRITVAERNGRARWKDAIAAGVGAC